MKRKSLLLFSFFLLVTLATFFYKLVFFQQVPFPGDLLVSTAPYKTESYLGYSPGGYPNKGQGRDVIDQLYPWKYFAITQEKKLQLPVWNPYNFSGNIALQNYQTGAFYPFNSLFFMLPFNLAWIVYILLQPVLAIFFMYLFLREQKIGKSVSFIASVSFAFCSYMTVWFEYGNIGHTFLWFPLILFSIQKILQGIKLKWFLLLFSAIVMCLLAGYIQGAFYVLIVSLLFFIVSLLHKKKRFLQTIVPVGMGYLSAILVGCIVIIPTLEFFQYSTRGGYSLPQLLELLNPWYFLVTAFAPDFFGNPVTRNYLLPQTYFEHVLYVGIPLTFFAFYAIEKVKTIETKFFAVLSLIIILITTNLPGVAFLYRIPFPITSTTIPTRALSIFIFSFIVLAAYGLQYWMAKKETKTIVLYIFSAIYIVIWFVAALLPKFIPAFAANLSIAKHNLILPTALAFVTIVGFYTVKKFPKLSQLLIILLIGIDSFYFFIKFTPFAPMQFMFPKNPVVDFLKNTSGIYRSWGSGTAAIPANYQTVQEIYSTEGFDALHIKEYTELLETSGTGKPSANPSRTDANIAPAFGTDDLKNNPYRQKILDLLGVKYLLDLRDSSTTDFDYSLFDREKYILVWQHNQWQIYENKQVLPRFFLTPQFVVKKSEKEQISQLYKEDLGKTVILSTNPALPIDQHATGKATLTIYTPNKVVFAVDSTGTQLLFLSDSYYHDWHATIDGNNAPIYKADYAFRAVEIPQGKHTVVLSFIPTSVYLGIIVAILGAFVAAGYSLYLYLHKKVGMI